MNTKSAEVRSPYKKDYLKARQTPHNNMWIVATELYLFTYLIWQYAKCIFLQLG